MATIKQRKAVENAVENGGIVSRAMIDAGYSPATAKNPEKLTKSRAWQELMDEYLSSDDLVEQHNKFLHSKREEIGVKALDMAYKLKGSYAPDKNINLNIEMNVDDEAIQQLANELEIHERTNQSGNGAAADPLDKEVQHQD